MTVQTFYSNISEIDIPSKLLGLLGGKPQFLRVDKTGMKRSLASRKDAIVCITPFIGRDGAVDAIMFAIHGFTAICEPPSEVTVVKLMRIGINRRAAEVLHKELRKIGLVKPDKHR